MIKTHVFVIFLILSINFVFSNVQHLEEYPTRVKEKKEIHKYIQNNKIVPTLIHRNTLSKLFKSNQRFEEDVKSNKNFRITRMIFPENTMNTFPSNISNTYLGNIIIELKKKIYIFRKLD